MTDFAVMRFMRRTRVDQTEKSARAVREQVRLAIAGVLSLLLTGVAGLASAAEHKVESLGDPPPQAAISAEIAALLGGPALRVTRAPSRVVCDVWLCKEWVQAKAPEKAAGSVLYPLQPGQLIGVVSYPKRGTDFRDQKIAEGVYTLRYGHQPIDGAHVGTSATRDFLLLLPAAADKTPAPLDYKTLTKLSAEAAGSTHPLLLPLQKPVSAEGDVPAIRHKEEGDWWIVKSRGMNRIGDQSQPLAMEWVVVGKASE